MFEGEKTWIFWIGLVILGLSSIILFTVLWYTVLISLPSPYWDWRYLVPPIVGPVLFILIGLYMMKSGVKKEKRDSRKTKTTVNNKDSHQNLIEDYSKSHKDLSE